jgi:poly-gamma-glutamate capsule biosynthesis protein CapA/YwtB (metallophosphatase superfamily)
MEADDNIIDLDRVDAGVLLEAEARGPPPRRCLRLFLGGDVMTGRGVDQIMRRPCAPRIHESFLHSAVDYVHLAEKANGPIPRKVDAAYVWGAALDEWDRMRPDARIVNLETALTRSEDRVSKGVNYRMSPENADCLAAAKIDLCALANNHVIDWGRAGLLDTLATLNRFYIKTAGAGRDRDDAEAPATLEIAGSGRILVFALASETSGVPNDWAARDNSPGIFLIDEGSEEAAMQVAERIADVKRPCDLVVVSVHWGSNWGYGIPDEQRRFARTVIDRANVAAIFGHSSHHAKGFEIYRQRLILYGCGDFLNDYEGIRGFEEFRGDLALMYFADFDRANGGLVKLTITPLQIKGLRLVRPSRSDVEWVRKTLDRECGPCGVRAAIDAVGSILVDCS